MLKRGRRRGDAYARGKRGLNRKTTATMCGCLNTTAERKAQHEKKTKKLAERKSGPTTGKQKVSNASCASALKSLHLASTDDKRDSECKPAKKGEIVENRCPKRKLSATTAG